MNINKKYIYLHMSAGSGRLPTAQCYVYGYVEKGHQAQQVDPAQPPAK